MADRIFINKDSGQYSEKELNRIDWKQVRDGMVQVHKAANAGKNLNPFGMVTGILDTRLAQFDTADFAEDDMPQAPSDESRKMMIAEALASGQEIDTEDAQFGMDNVEEIAQAADMSPEEVSSILSDYVSINPVDDLSGENEFEGDMEAMASRVAKKKLPAALEKFKFKGKDSKNEEKDEDSKEEDSKEKDKDEDEDEEADAMLRKGDERKANRKIVFTDASKKK